MNSCSNWRSAECSRGGAWLCVNAADVDNWCAVTDATLSSMLLYLWLAVLLTLIAWLLVRRWRQFAETGVWDTAVPHRASPLTEIAHKKMVAAMMAGGLLLIILGQVAISHVPVLWPVGVIMALGAGCFLWAGNRLRRNHFSDDWLANKLHLGGHWLGVAAWQVVLLWLAFGLTLLARLAGGNEPLAWHWGASVIAWLMAIVFCVVGGLPLAEARVWLRNGLGLARWEWGFVVALFAGAWLLRGTAVTSFPNTFSGDEGSAGLHALLFLQGKADNWFTIGWFSFPSFYYALQSVFLALFGQTVEALRYFAALGGALAVVATYFLARVLFGRGTAVIASFLLMSSHYHIHMSRIGLNNIWDSLFGTLVLLGVWHGWHTGRRLPFLLAGLALGLGQYFYVTVRILPLLLFLWVFGLWWRQPVRWRERLPGFVLCGYTAVITVLPLAIYFAGHWDEFQAPFNRVTIWGERLASMAAAEGQPQLLLVLRQMSQAAQGFTHLPLRLLYEPGTPLLMPLAAGLFLAGLAWAVLRFNAKYALLLLPLLAIVFLSGFSQDPPASQRFVLAPPVVVIFMALPVALLGRWLQKLWPMGRAWIWLGTAVLILWLSVVDITFYFGRLYDHYTLGGFNTVVATEIAEQLQAEAEPPDVYFFGFPRMGYFSLATIPYLAPQVTAVDAIEPLTVVPEWNIEETTLFIFLPERLDELALVQQAYENGVYEEFRNEDSQFLYAVYRVEP